MDPLRRAYNTTAPQCVGLIYFFDILHKAGSDFKKFYARCNNIRFLINGINLHFPQLTFMHENYLDNKSKTTQIFDRGPTLACWLIFRIYAQSRQIYARAYIWKKTLEKKCSKSATAEYTPMGLFSENPGSSVYLHHMRHFQKFYLL